MTYSRARKDRLRRGRPSLRRRHRIHTGLVVLFAVLLMACDGPTEPAPPATSRPVRAAATPATPAEYVTSKACSSCHAEAYAAWTGSHHDLAMQPATAATVRGDFDDATFTQHGVTSRFFRREERFVVHTLGADGAMADFEIRYTFGATPLQQYLVQQPDGRLHALTTAWDTRPAADGGQRWFELNEEEAPPGDVLHWTGPAQNWNATCAACHSTALRKKFDIDTGSYDTAWSDVNVGCEACHGPGSRHVTWAERAASDDTDDDRGLVVDLGNDGAHWVMNATTGIARRSTPLRTRTELDTCAPCHARRSMLREADPGTPFLDAYRPALLEPGLYHVDGQILDEVYVWGSFVQSRMYRAGVTCSDCHEPHALTVRDDTERVCHQCHDAARFATTGHHHHDPGTPGSACVDCHMPARTYMGVDERRDHGFHVPRPDLSARLGTPNACNGCHTNQPASWAADTIADWPGTKHAGTPHFADVMVAAARGVPEAVQGLAGLSADPELAGIVRATALTQLSGAPPPLLAAAIMQARDDPDPLIRFAAAGAAAGLPPTDRVALLTPLLGDPLALVRSEAGRNLAPAPRDGLDETQVRELDAALRTYRSHQRTNADQPSAHVNLGLLYAELQQPSLAESAYRRAIAVGPWFIPAYVNLADLYRATGRDEDSEAMLLAALEQSQDVAEVHHALGLLRVRQRQLDTALPSLETAASLAPENPRFAYVYGVALHTAGQTEQALEVLRAASARHPHDTETSQALATFSREAGAQHGHRLAVAPRSPQPPQRRPALSIATSVPWLRTICPASHTSGRSASAEAIASSLPLAGAVFCSGPIRSPSSTAIAHLTPTPMRDGGTPNRASARALTMRLHVPRA